MHLKTIAATLNCSELQVKNVIQLLNEGATIPFIARYRKEITNSLDEVKIEEIKTLNQEIIEFILINLHKLYWRDYDNGVISTINPNKALDLIQLNRKVNLLLN